MVHIIIGIVAVLLGMWGTIANWLIFVEVFKAAIFLVLVGFGVVALMAGVRRLRATK